MEAEGYNQIKTPLQRNKKRPLGQILCGYLFVSPALFVIFALIGYPFLVSIYLSLTNSWVGQPGEFVGLQNFNYLIHNSIFLQCLKNSFVFTSVSLLIKTNLGMALALLLNRKIKYRRIIRGALLLPWIIPNALSITAWLWMFEPLFSVINWVLIHLGIVDTGILWLSNTKLAMASIICVNVWRGLPFFAITLLAGLVSIPQDLYKASRVDGAGNIRTFFYITLPLLKPLLIIVVLFSTVFTISDFNIVFILTKGGPMNMTHLFSTLAYQVGLAGGRLSLGAAISLFLFPVLVIVVYFQLKTIRRGTSFE